MIEDSSGKKNVSIVDKFTESQPRHSKLITAVLLGLVVVHVLLLSSLADRYSPTVDEVAHLPAGLAIWNDADFSLYRVNPPLVRAVAAVPVLFVHHEEDWSRYKKDSQTRLEWAMGRQFVAANGVDSQHLFKLARWTCLPFSVIGLLVCYFWGTQIYSQTVGCIAAGLWCFSPNLLGHGSLITPDVAATSLGLLAAWRFSEWIENSSMLNTFWAGASLGLAMLTKLTWISLPALWIFLAFMNWVRYRQIRSAQSDLVHLSFIVLLGLNLLNLGYLYSGSFTLLGEYDFYSTPLSGTPRIPGENLPANRFQDSWVGKIPVPFPKDYVTGIDLQKVDFEQGKWSYLRGEVKDPGGWYHYYLIGLLVKVPAATLLLFLAGLVACWRDESIRSSTMRLMPLMLPVIVLFVVASLQTKMNRHVRYVFPILPAIYLIGATAGVRWPKAAITAVVMTAISSLACYPHSLSYFNEFIGGPQNGHRYLIDSNLDWGQDMPLVQDWIDQREDELPVWLVWPGDVSLKHVGVKAKLLPTGELPAGWHIVSRSERHHASGRYRAYDQLIPVDKISNTYDVYLVQPTTKKP